MFVWIYICLVSSVQAAEPGHLKPGALVGHLGHVALVEDVLWVKYPYATLRAIPGRLKEVLGEIDLALTQLQDEANKTTNTTNWDDPLDLLKLFASRLSFVNDTVALALDTYLGLDGPVREKRGWLDGIGELSRDLFGTAMQKDVDELRDRYNQLLTLASSNNRAIEINCQRLAKLDQHVSDLGLYVNRLKLGLNKVLETIDSLYHFMVLNQALPALENAINSLLHVNQQIVTNVVDAVHGRVTPALFPVQDFTHALEVGKMEYGLTPLFDIRGIQHYYPLLESFITTDAIVIHVPFQSKDVLEVHQVEPFPFSVNNTLMTLDLPPSIVLISADFSLYAAGSVNDLQHCKTTYLHYYYCPASLFAFFPITGGVCEVVLTQANSEKALELCPYTTVAPKPLFHKTFFSHHYFFFTRPFYISILCPEGTVYKEVSGHLAVYFSCHVRSANLTTFPSKLHQGFVGNSSLARIYPLTSLNNIHISSIKYVNNKVSEFKFSNTSDLETAVHNALPGYLHPYVHYPSLLIPIVIIIIIIIPLCCWVKKALTLYNVLNSRRLARIRNQESKV